MDVMDLAPALLAVGEMFKAADAVFNGSETGVKTAVKAEFRAGSFEVVLSVNQQLRDLTAGVLPALHLLGADRLISAVVGGIWDQVAEAVREKVPNVVVGLLKLIGKLGGDPPESIAHDESTGTNIFVFGSNNSIRVDQRTTELYRNSTVRAAALRLASPLERNGVRSIRADKEGVELASLERRDFPELGLEAQSLALAPVQLSAPQPQELIVRIVKANFLGDKWSVSDGSKPFEVVMEDGDFKRRVHAREVGFFDGDMYRVRMITEQKLDGRGLSTVRRIVRVVEPYRLAVQGSLALPPPKRRIRKT
jgi:hypothetical protein